MLLLDRTMLEERRRASRGPMAPLFESLAAELEPLLDRGFAVPREKALLSRVGGRCERCHVPLEFDPFSPDAHRCPSCGSVFSGELHRRAWITGYQLWLAERAVHAALFHALRGEARHAALARDILRGLADAYLTYPNRDNVLGPTRPFFSTYLESIWLLQICIAADLLEHAGDAATADLARDRIIEPSSLLVADFDEGLSNRQVWNNAALIAAATVCRRPGTAAAQFDGPSGLSAHLELALLPDGTWFEGDNYHQFALRGLWYAAAMRETMGDPQPRTSADRLANGFLTPFVTALPDFTMPSRKDSPYAVSLRQWRFAELAEIGYARRPDAQLGAALMRCYEPEHERRDTGRARSTADVERNMPPCRLSRADLGWRALLFALPELPTLTRQPARSVHLPGQGLAVFRRPPDVYVALDYGQSGGGHGHPDRLNVLLYQGAIRWLDDVGTGSYVDPSLHWYRSTLAHNAPLVDGRSQPPREGELLAYDERDDVGWARAAFQCDDVRLERTLVVAESYLVDQLRWSAPRDVRVELPWHVDAETNPGIWERSVLGGGAAAEDGFAFTREAAARRVPAGELIALRATRGGVTLRATLNVDTDATLLRALAPGPPGPSPEPPGEGSRPFHIVRIHGETGRIRAVVAWGEPATVRFEPSAVTVDEQRESHVHEESGQRWRITRRPAGGAAARVVDLGGVALPAARPVTRAVGRATDVVLRRRDAAPAWLAGLETLPPDSFLLRELGEANYRRAEESWREAGEPRARIACVAWRETLTVFVEMRAAAQRFAAATADNDLDNEHPDTLGAGVQVYAGTARGRGAWMLVPDGDDGRVRIRRLDGSAPLANPASRWERRAFGYELRADIPLPQSSEGRVLVDLDLVINDAVAGRVRRRGQLVARDVRGERVYLRGDREEPIAPIRLEIVS